MKNKYNNFAYFIASYGKPVDMPTMQALTNTTAKYPIYVVIGTDDPKIDEYKKAFPNNLLIFDKADYIDKVDDLGLYAKTHKVCTYSRLAITDFAKQLKIKYVCYLFDDIEYFRLRYVRDNQITGTKQFCIDDMIDLYIDLLNSSKDLYVVGPPNSSFYIGVNVAKSKEYSTRFGNMLVYDVDKELEPYHSSVLEDMSIILYNNMVGKMSICPFGLQVACRAPHTTKDCYGDMTATEYNLHHSIICNGITVNLKRPTIPYVRFTPKIIDEKYRKTKHANRLF